MWIHGTKINITLNESAQMDGAPASEKITIFHCGICTFHYPGCDLPDALERFSVDYVKHFEGKEKPASVICVYTSYSDSYRIDWQEIEENLLKKTYSSPMIIGDMP